MHVTVLGAGPAGAGAAIALARSGVEILLVDPDPAGRSRLGEGLPAAGADHLRALGVWEAFRADGHLPCSGFLSRWGRPEPDYRPAMLDPRGPSWQLDRARFDTMLRDAAAAAVGVPAPWRLRTAQRADGDSGRGWALQFTHGGTVRRVRTDFVIDATGRRRAFARVTGVPQRVDDSLVCVTGRVADPDPEDARTIVETTEHGWWYASRIPRGTVVVALFTSAAQAGPLGAGTPAGWHALLARTGPVGARVGGPAARLVEPLRTAAAGSSRLLHCGGEGWLAVGDAACAHDPLSSRGLHDAVSGGRDAAGCVLQALAGDSDAPRRSAARTAARYHRYRRELAWFYDQEQRFSEAPFWRDRGHALSAGASRCSR
jgi:flavin-dependent dehydrogenase